MCDTWVGIRIPPFVPGEVALDARAAAVLKVVWMVCLTSEFPRETTCYAL